MWLRYGDHSVLVSPMGGSILQWQWKDRFILGPTQVVRTGDHLRKRGETHWCFPNFGLAPEEVGQDYPKHGFLRNTVFHHIRHTDHDVRFMARDHVPEHDITMHVDVSIQENRVKTWMSATNNRLAPTPILPALHPYFATPSGELNIKVGGEMVAAVFPNGETVNVSSKSMTILRTGDVVVTLGGLGMVEFVLPAYCTHIAVWSDRPSDYVCVEPVFGTPGTFGLPQGRWLGSNEQTFNEVVFNFTPLK